MVGGKGVPAAATKPTSSSAADRGNSDVAYINGTSASETLAGTSSNDTIYGNGGTDILLGQDGDDWLYGADGADRLEGGSGNDVLYGAGGDDTLLGGAGADRLEGGAGRDVLDGGDGNDDIVVVADQVSDTLTGGAGADTFLATLGNSGNRTLTTADVITDFSVAEGDRVYLGVTDGRNWSDYLIWYGAITTPNFSLTAGAKLPDAPEAGFISVSTWTGGDSTYLLVDVDSNGALNDGDFVLEFRGATFLSREMFTQGTLTASIGTAGADAWSGGAGRDVYFGFSGSDTANGLGGDDTLNGGDGDDALYGGDGDDYLYGGLGGDVLEGGAGRDTLYAGLDAYTNNDSLNSTNILRGGDGDDTLYAGIGKDVLEGGAGNDLLTMTTPLDAAGDIFRGGDGDDELYAVNATLDGGTGNDTLWVASGNTITGGTGADLFKGLNYGYPNWTVNGVSAITDFNVAEGDHIDIGELSSYSIGGVVFRGALNGPNFDATVGQKYSTDDFGGAFVQAWTWTKGGATYLFVDLDRNGTLSADDLAVKFTNGVTITADSFLPGYFKGTMGGGGVDDFTGGPGDDIYYGAGGDDLLHGGDGNDLLAGNAGADKLWGELGADRLLGGDGDDVIDGGAGNDTIFGGNGSDTLTGGDGNDNLYAGEDGGYGSTTGDVDILYGGAGNDWLSGGYSARSEAHGGDGDDFLSGGGQLFGDAGKDVISVTNGIAHGGDGDDQLSGGYDKGSTFYGDAGADSFGGSSGDDIIYAELGDTNVYGGSGADQLHIAALRAGETARLTYVGGADGADTFIIEASLGAGPELSLYGDYDFDTLDLSRATTTVTVDLTLNTTQETGMGRFRIGAIEGVIAGDFGAVIKGDAYANRFVGGVAGDTLSGGGGVDVLRGNGGDDVMDGGDGVDIAEYAGASTNYSWSIAADGSVQVKDLRAGAPDGVDKLTTVEVLRFSDRYVVPGALSAPALSETGFATVFRMSLKAGVEFAPTANVAMTVATGTYAPDVVTVIIAGAGATTSVASLSYQFFTGKIPTEAGIDYLVSPTGPNPNNLNSAYYQSFNLENRYINFAVNLGKIGDGNAKFTADYGGLSLFDATKKAYAAIFGGTPTDEKTHALIDTRIDYFAYYGGDGANGIGAKAAMVGWLLAEAEKADLGVMVRSNDAWLADLTDGSAPFAINVLDPAKGYWRADYIFAA
jgi:Ca2+-binding RTX toxin-like protein